jgi:hypothetical protein
MKTIYTLLFLSFYALAFGQNENPYSIFGYEATVMKEITPFKEQIDQFVFVNPDTVSSTRMLAIDMRNREITFFDKNGIVTKTETIDTYSLARWLSVDPKNQFASPYVGMGNNPVSSIDPDGQFVLSLLAKIIAGDIDNAGDVFRTILTGSITDPINLIGASNPVNQISTSVGILSGLGNGLLNGDWDRLGNTGKIWLGNFYTDNNRPILDEIWQGVSRNTWEGTQTKVGYNYSQWRNITGNVDRVDYLGGATFTTNENAGREDGVSLGNFININIRDRINGNFTDRVIRDPLFMHEYGHTFDSQIFGPLYLPVVGLSSALSASRAVFDPLTGGSTHDTHWTERRANRHAARYFEKYYPGVNWSIYEVPFNPFGFFPR